MLEIVIGEATALANCVVLVEILKNLVYGKERYLYENIIE